MDKLNDLLENKAPSSPATLEPATEASKTSQDIVPVSLSMDKYFSNLFFASYQAFNELSENTKTDEISFNGTYFVIRGRARLNADSQSSPALYFLRIGIRGDNDKIKAGDKIFVIGYLIPFPFGDNIQDVRTAMSMVSGFKILR